jgi:hypothetical protein
VAPRCSCPVGVVDRDTTDESGPVDLSIGVEHVHCDDLCSRTIIIETRKVYDK